VNKKCEALAQDVFFSWLYKKTDHGLHLDNGRPHSVDTSLKVNEVKGLTLVSSIRVFSRSRFWHFMETSVCVLLSRFLGIHVFKIT